MELLMIPAALLCLVIGVLWVLMPFAIFGTKDLLRELLREQQRTNELLAQISRQNSGTSSGAPEPIRIDCGNRSV